MKKNTVKTIALLLISIIVGSVSFADIANAEMRSMHKNQKHGNMQMMSNKSEGMVQSMLSEGRMMTDMLKQETGDAFDAMFMKLMKAHHTTAIWMAEVALQNAKHQELKDMAQEMKDSQTHEIEQMEKWEEEWGYE